MAEFTGITFRCQLPSQQGTNDSALCLNGASCAFAPGAALEEYCVCPPGVADDNTVGHFPNCGLQSQSILPAVFGMLTVLDVVAAVTLIYFSRSVSAAARRIQLLLIAYVVTSWTVYLGMFLQTGTYEVSLVAYVILQILHHRMMVDIILVFTRPIYALVARLPEFELFRILMRVVEAVFDAISLGLLVTCLVFAREANPARYNFFMAISLIFQPLGILSLSAILTVQIYRLDRALPSLSAVKGDSQSDVVGLFRARLRTLWRANVAVSMAYSAFFLFPILFFSIGSFPYQIVFVSALHLSAPFLAVALGLGLRNQQRETPSARKLASVSLRPKKVSRTGDNTERGGSKDDITVRPE